MEISNSETYLSHESIHGLIIWWHYEQKKQYQESTFINENKNLPQIDCNNAMAYNITITLATRV